MLQDLRFALRQFARRPAFTISAVLVLGLGLGANTAIFSVVNAFLLHAPPYPQANRVVSLFEEMHLEKTEKFNEVSPANFLDWQRYSTGLQSMSAYVTTPASLSSPTGTFEPERVDVCACSGNLLDTLRVQPLLGRPFRPEEDRYGAPRVAIISYALWQRRFGGAADVIGKDIRIDGEKNQIIGVMPRGFLFPQRTVEVWQPLLLFLPPVRQQRHDTHFLKVVGRLQPGVNAAQLQTQLSGIERRYHAAHPDEVTGSAVTVVSLQRALTRDVRRPLLLLFCAVSCVLLIACINVANLLLARASERNREVSIRAVVGASRARIVRQLVTESVLLALAGGTAGLMFALSIAQILASHAPGAESLLGSGDVSLSPAVFLFTLGAAILAGAAAGLFPALRTTQVDFATRLREGGRSVTSSRSQGRFRNILVGIEVALSLVLLISAGLLLRSFSAVFQVQPGIRVDHTLTVSLSLPDAGYKKTERVAAFARQLRANLRSIPGVIDAGLSSCPPIGEHCNDLVFWIEGTSYQQGSMPDALARDVDPGYFSAAGIPLVQGRVFNQRDGIGFDEKHPQTGQVIVSETFVKQFLGHQDPIGTRLHFEVDAENQKVTGTPMAVYQIIGVVGDVRTKLDLPAQPTVYKPLLDGRDSDMVAVIHTAGDPQSVALAARDQIRRLDPNLAVFDVETMQETLGQTAADRRFSVLLFSSFAGLALLLAAVGLYGVLAYSVTQRRNEIGVRIALGATRGEVRALMLREGLRPAGAGIMAGLLGAALASQALSKSLFGISPADPLTFGVVPIVLLAVASLACYVPALRATRVDPLEALRAE